MNKVYKVIWSSVKHAYVVVSELAHRGRKKSCRAKAVCAMAAVLALTGSFNSAFADEIKVVVEKDSKGNVSVYEEGTTPINIDAIYTGEKAENNLVIGANGTVVNTSDSVIWGDGVDINNADGSLAIGKENIATNAPESIVYGNKNELVGGYNTVVGNDNKVYGFASTVTGSAKDDNGYNTVVGYGIEIGVKESGKFRADRNVAIGTYIKNHGGTGNILIGDKVVLNEEGDDSITMGTGAQGSDESVIIGGHAKATGSGSVAVGNGTSSYRNAVAIGADSQALGYASVAIGYMNKIGGDDPDSSVNDSSIAIGRYVEIKEDSSYSIAMGYAAAIGEGSGDSIAMGDEATIGDNTKYSTAMGYEATIGDNTVRSTAMGYMSKIGNASVDTIAMGSWAEAGDAVEKSMALGYLSEIGSEAYGSNAIGAWAAVGDNVWYGNALGTVSEVNSHYGTAVGSFSKVNAKKGTALGYGAEANHENSLALGSDSMTAEAVGTTSFTLDKVYNTEIGKYEDVTAITFDNFAGSNPYAAVSVGRYEQEVEIDGEMVKLPAIYRTITNVAAGRISADSTDAINGSQLYAVAGGLQKQIDEINENIENGGSGDDHYHTVNGNDKENQNTGAGTANDGTTGNVDTNPAGGAGSVTDGTGTNTDPAGDKPTLGGGYVGGDGNLLINYDTDKNGDKYYDISLNKDLNVDSIKVNNNIQVGDKVTINENSVNVGDVTINEENIDMGGNKIINVQEGTAGTDAVNVNQLNKLEQNIESKINRVDGKVNKVGAGAAALAALHPLDFDPDDKLHFSAGVGHYEDSTAAAIGAFYQPNDDTLFSVGGTVGNGEEMVNLGVSFRFGQQSNQSRSKKAMAKEIIELRTEVAELKAMVYSLTQATFDPYKSEIFPDVPENHWAYDYVAVVAGNGILEGYPSGKFDGSREMTRYEMAAVIYRLMNKGVKVDDRMVKEFAPELARVKVDTLTHHKDGTPAIQRVRVIEGRG